MATSQDFVNWVCSGDIDYRYLASILVSENSSFSLFSRGTTHQTIYFPEAKAFHVLLPPIKEQKEIADIIWRLNDKIELNRRQNETLEAIARAIFKSWFVDFDPVRAKQQARARGATDAEVERAAMEAISPAVKTAHATANAQKPDTDYLSHLASLFPERLVDAAQGSANVAVGTSPWTGEGRTMQEQLSKTPGATTEIGLVPEGWEVKPLGEITSQLRRGITPKYCEDGGVVVINQKCIRDGRINLAYAKRHDPSTRKIDGRQLEGGDVLINSTGVGTLGRVAVVSEDLRGLIVDTHVTVARADIRQIDIGFFDLMMLTRQSEFESMGHGSTGQTELRKDRLSVLPTIVPLLELQNEFGRYIRACFGEVRANELQAQKLSVIRNTLFPKLISGQLRIPVAETIAEEAIA
jgi:type I restriction enzyme S subunit